MTLSQPPAPGARVADRWNAVVIWSAITLVIVGLLTILAVSIITARANQEDRRRLTEEVGILADSRSRLHVAVTTAGSEAQTYALSGNAEARARYQIARSEYEAERATFLRLGGETGYEREAGTFAAAADRYADSAAAMVAAVDAANPAEAARIAADDAPQRFGIVMLASSSMDAAINSERELLRDELGDAERRSLVVLVLAATAASVAAVLLVWLAYRNRRLLRGLESEQRRLIDVVANVPGVVWETRGEPGLGERPAFVSEYLQVLTGYSVAEWIANPSLSRDIVHPDDRPRIAADAAAIYGGRRAGTSECRWTRRDGTVIDVLTYMAVVTDSEGRPAGMRGVTIDITDRVRAEQAARLGAQVSAVLFSSLDPTEALKGAAQLLVPQLADWCAIHLVDDEGVPRLSTVAHADPERARAARELQQRYAPSGGGGRWVLDVVRSGDPRMISEIPDEILVRTARDDEQLRILRELGMKSYICAPMIARGRVLGALTLLAAESGRRYDERDLATAQDLAWRAAVALDNARLYRDVESERARFASIVASVAHAVLQLDARGSLVDMNPAAEQLLGYRVDELRGRSIHQVLHPSHAGGGSDGAPCALVNSGAGGPSGSAFDTFARKDGSRFDVELTRSPIVVEGRPLGAVVVFQDVTQRLRQERMKDDFLAFASHELRSPLTTVNGMAKWLEKRMVQQPDRYDADTREAIETLSQGADRMGSIVELFLDLARIDSDRLVLESQDVDLSLLLLEETSALAIRYPQARVETSLPDHPVIAQSDENRLRQVLTNLLDNAVKYGGEPPRVIAGLETSAEGAAFVVRDNGRGIPEREATRIFERFYRGSGEETRRSRGLGIGLFLAREIVDRVGGRLTFTNTASGTEFRVWLPLAKDVRRPAGPTQAPAQR